MRTIGEVKGIGAADELHVSINHVLEHIWCRAIEIPTSGRLVEMDDQDSVAVGPFSKEHLALPGARSVPAEGDAPPRDEVGPDLYEMTARSRCPGLEGEVEG